MVKVSVIIPTYNRVYYLINAIKSVLDQTYKNFEIIVIDDGSVDDTRNIIKKYDEIKYFYVNHVGLENAKGEYIAFLDSDDQWFKNKLEKQIEIMEKFPNTGLVCTNAFISINDRQISE